MKKLCFCFDIDNTLVPWPAGVIPVSAMMALDGLRAQGHRLVIATGRLQKDAMVYAQRAGIRDVVADGGYSITIDGVLQSMRSLDIPACRYVLRQLEEAGIPWAVTTENEPVRYTHCRSIGTQKAPWDHFATDYRERIHLDSLDCIYKIYMYMTREEEAAQRIDYGTLECIRYGEESILIEPMDKATGIQVIADHYGIPYENVVTFGDGNNDLRMFKPIWTNIAMGNARPALKEKADYVTTPCDQNGIYDACRHFGWIE